MAFRLTPAAGMRLHVRVAALVRALRRRALPAPGTARPHAILVAVLASAALAGCATMTESSDQYVMVLTVLDHQQVAGIGCVLSNDAGRWFVTSPGRVQIRKSTKPLTVDCRKDQVWAFDQIGPRQNASRWGNILLTAGAGQLVDRQTGAGFDYPQTLTVVLQRGEPNRQQPGAPAQASPPPASGELY